jgi:hypothetical protein
MSDPDDDQNSCYEVNTGAYFMKKYGLTAENRPIIQLNPDNVPDELKPFIPLAEEWGIGDDLIRGDVIDKASKEQLEKLVSQVDAIWETLWKWLDENNQAPFTEPRTEEWYAFCCMELASEEARVLLEYHPDRKTE